MNAIKMVAYSSEDLQVSAVLNKIASAERNRVSIEIYRDFGRFLARLSSLGQPMDIVVLAVASREQLEEIIARKEFLEGLRLVIVAPDEDAETAARAHVLRPRFLADRKTSLSTLELVLERIVQQIVETRQAITGARHPDSRFFDRSRMIGRERK